MFEKKIWDEEAWKLYRRVYKKYCVRCMKGNMSHENFNAWVEYTVARRDTIRSLLEGTSDPEKREELNRIK